MVSLLVILPSGAYSQETYRFERMWPTLLQPWYFNYPHDIAVSPDGFVYIADSSYIRVQKYNSSGQFITMWGHEGTGNGEFGILNPTFPIGPSGVTTDSNSNVYVADTYNHRIQKFSSDGSYITKWGRNNGDGTAGNGNGEFQEPFGISLDIDGYVYVADIRNHRIQKFSSDGSYITKWGRNGGDGSSGTADGEFMDPSAVAVGADGYVYVTDTGNRRIQKFTSNGSFIIKWDNTFPGGAQYDSPQDITMDASCNLYVTDIGAYARDSYIYKINTDGELIERWGSLGGHPEGIAVDGDGYLYITEAFQNRIKKLTPSGQELQRWSSSEAGAGRPLLPEGIAIGSNKTVYVSDPVQNCIHKFTAEGIHITSQCEARLTGQFDGPVGITVDQYDNVYICDGGNNRIQKIAPDGHLITTLVSGDNLPLVPESIAIDSSGNVYVTDQASSVDSFGNLQLHHRIQKFRPLNEGSNYESAGIWNTWGSGQEFYQPFGITIAGDASGTEYVCVADWGSPMTSYAGYIHTFTTEGQYITTWFGTNDGSTFYRPWGLASDNSGNIYVADAENCRFLKFNPGGELASSLGSCGSNPEQMNELHYLAVDSEEKVYVADKYNNRIQVFTKIEILENSRVIIVAGGGSYANSLWDATQMCASFAYRALTYQGFNTADITYLSEDTDLDLDKDGESNVEDVPSIPRLNAEIMQAGINNVENLVLYLTDHGGTNESGEGTFRLSASETLAASDLAAMLDIFPGRVIVIIDACQSGSFINALEGANRIIITSTGPFEKAKFINQGTISFSNFFWTGVFNGSSLLNSYNTASGAVNIIADQTPQIRPTDVSPNIYIGNGVAGMVGEAPGIGSITISPPELQLETQAVLRANNVIDPDGIARVWAVIWPPNYNPGSVANPLTDLPSVDLLPVAGEEGTYAGDYDGFVSMGLYQIAVYAMDRMDNMSGNPSNPRFTSISRNLTRSAVIVGGGAGGELNRTMIEKSTSLAYNAFIDQRYDPDEDIYFMSVTTFLPDVITYFPTVDNLESHLHRLANEVGMENLDLTIYLIGAGDTGTFAMNDDVNMSDEDKILTSSKLHEWLDNLQNQKQSRVTIIYDGNKSGSFIPALMPPEGKERIITTSTGAESAAYFKTEGNVSFSSFFWDRVAAGATIGNAFIYAKSAISYCTRENDISFSCYRPQHPLMDANSNGIANELNDYEIATALYLGDGVAYADDLPLIGSVSVAREGDWITIAAHDVSSTNPVTKVWAVIRPIGYCPGFSEGVPQEVFEPEPQLFDPDGDGTYAGSFNVDYACKVTVYAMSLDAEGDPNISASLEPIINQPGGDIYEDPDNDGKYDDDSSEANVIVVNHPSSQPHTLYHPEGVDDTDWVKFYAVPTAQGHTYTVEAGNLEGTYPVIELYKEDDLIEPLDVQIEYPADDNDKVWFDFDCTYDGLFQEGIYYVKVSWGATGEGEMSYDLRVYDGWAELTATVAGRVEDAITGEPIDGAVITIVNGTGSALSTRGEYMISEVPGSYTMTAREDRHVDSSYGIRIDTNDQYVRQDIDMHPIDTGGCRSAAECDDGLFCNGIESCVNRTCQPGTGPCVDDGIFCNGEESCNEANDVCEHTGNPCPATVTCDEERDVCTDCTEDAPCDDGLFCNGVETCVGGDCQDGTDPCPEGVECDEETDTCLTPSITVIPQRIMQSHWIPLPFFLSIRGTNTHFSEASKVTFTPPSIMPLYFVINQETLFCMGLMMPAWLTGPLGESIEVSVKTGLEVVAGELDLRSLPFMLGKEKQETGARIQ